jgi:hypothetical protein
MNYLNNFLQNFLNNNDLFNKYSFTGLLVLFFMFSFSEATIAQVTSAEAIRTEASTSKQNMYVIERTVPGAGDLTQEELKSISQTSCNVLDGMGSEIKWMHSYVTGDKIFCVYTAPNEEMVRKHGADGGFPVDAVHLVKNVIDPSTAE